MGMQAGVDLALIERNLRSVREKIAEAALRTGRSPEQVTLIPISKTQPAEAIRAIYQLGCQQVGENRVAEALPKMVQLSDLQDLRWHMVGHIQSRKAKDVAPNFDWVHSADRMKIVQRLDRFAGEAGKRLPILLECNVSGEEAKSGWPLASREDWPEFAQTLLEIASMPNLDVRGLMTMAPWVPEESVLRTTFQRLRALRNFLQEITHLALPELSMGMTDDFVYAVEEGATMVRIGRAIFGPRGGV